MKPVKASELKSFVLQVLDTCGVSREDAETTADGLVMTDTWGVFTHGTKLLSGYARRLRSKGLKPRGQPRIQREGPAWALVDGDSSLGMVTSVFATKLAISKAATSGVAYVLVRNSCHFGAAGYYAHLAAEAGQIGMIVSNDVPSVAAVGSLGPVMGSNPFAFGAPSAHEGSMVLDFATAEVAGGKVAAAAATGKPIPSTWIVDDQGKPTTDANLFVQRKAYLAPMAGHKGYGLALMIEVMSGALSGSAMRDKVGVWMGNPMDKPTDHSHAFLTINPAVFLGGDSFPARTDELFHGIRSGPASKEAGHVKIPGEIEQDKRKKALAEGIPLPSDVIDMLRLAATENGLPVPEFLS